MGQMPLFFIFLIITIAAMAVIYPYMIQRAIIKVIRILREQEAVDVWSAKPPKDLGLAPRSLMDRFRDPRRDYKPIALAVLKKLGIVLETGTGKLYLNEKSLNRFCVETNDRLKVCTLSK